MTNRSPSIARLVEGEHRQELRNDLAMAIVNRGNALLALGRLEETVAVHDESIAIRRVLVEGEHREELRNDLAGAIVNRGSALVVNGWVGTKLSRCDGTISCSLLGEPRHLRRLRDINSRSFSIGFPRDPDILPNTLQARELRAAPGGSPINSEMKARRLGPTLRGKPMKKFAAMAIIPLFGGFLYAQEANHEVTTTSTTWNGTLVDASCQSSHTVNKESSTKTNPDQSVTHKESTRTETVDCPVTTTTTSFGLLTPEGRYMHFDDPSNTKIVEVVKTNTGWTGFITGRKPIKVKVVGTAKGEVVVMESIH
jgi:hypothetical protein